MQEGRDDPFRDGHKQEMTRIVRLPGSPQADSNGDSVC